MPKINKLNSPYETKQEETARWSNSENKAYKTAGWIKFRKGYILHRLSIGDCVCDLCRKLFPSTSDVQLDHITPISMGGNMFSYSNLQMLCRSCHTRKTSKEIHKRRTENDNR